MATYAEIVARDLLAKQAEIVRKPCAVPSSSVKKRLSGGFSCIGATQRWEECLEEGTQRYLAD